MTDEQYEKLMDQVTTARISLGVIRVVASLWFLAWLGVSFLNFLR